jgi:hypothetical protein
VIDLTNNGLINFIPFQNIKVLFPDWETIRFSEDPNKNPKYAPFFNGIQIEGEKKPPPKAAPPKKPSFIGIATTKPPKHFLNDLFCTQNKRPNKPRFPGSFESFMKDPIFLFHEWVLSKTEITEHGDQIMCGSETINLTEDSGANDKDTGPISMKTIYYI